MYSKDYGWVKRLVSLLLSIVVISSISAYTSPVSAASAGELDTFSIMQLADTQYIAKDYQQLFYDTTSWIVNNAANYNVKMVVHTGDIINYNATQSVIDSEWACANASMSALLNAGIPYAFCTGNQDVKPYYNPNGNMTGDSYLAFNMSYLRSKSYWVDDFNSKNTAVKFTVNNFTFLIVSIEFAATAPTLTWMREVLDANQDCNIIVAAHMYLNQYANYSNPIPVFDSWGNPFKEILDSYPNVFLTLSGHYGEADAGTNMTRVGNREEIFFDRSNMNGFQGGASVRIYTFNLTSKIVSVSTYALDTQTWLTDAYNQFSFDASVINVPEGLTFAVMMIVSAVAVILGTRYFRKREKPVTYV
jgi:hypothetical protein